MSRIAFVTDSTCNMPDELVRLGVLRNTWGSVAMLNLLTALGVVGGDLGDHRTRHRGTRWRRPSAGSRA